MFVRSPSFVAARGFQNHRGGVRIICANDIQRHKVDRSFLVLMQGRHAESWEIVSKLHINACDLAGPESERYDFAKREFHQMVKQVEVDSQAWVAGGGMRQIFKRPSYRKRMWMGFFTQYSAQATGAMVVYSQYATFLPKANLLIMTDYMVNLYQGLGITGGMVLILGALYVTVATGANFLASLVMDYVGRVRLLSKNARVSSLLLTVPVLQLSHWPHGLHDHTLPRMHHGISIRITSCPCYKRLGRLLHLPVHLFLCRWHRCDILCLLLRALPNTHPFTGHGILNDRYLLEYGHLP